MNSNLREIVQDLYDAGYFRVKISKLSDFDKVVGGLCWCIQLLNQSGHGVDWDILFQENLTIKQRIGLSESIVDMLRQMHCPIPLQAHQIQGQDFPQLKLVIHWLIQQFAHVQNVEKLESLRKFSILQYQKNTDASVQQPIEEGKPALDNNIFVKATAQYKPQRQFTQMTRSTEETEDAKLQRCLLEYGEKIKPSNAYNEVEHAHEEMHQGKTESKEELLANILSGGLKLKSRHMDKSKLTRFERKYFAAEKAALEEEKKNYLVHKERETKYLAKLKEINSTSKDATASADLGRFVNSNVLLEASTEYGDGINGGVFSHSSAFSSQDNDWVLQKKNFERQKNALEIKISQEEKLEEDLLEKQKCLRSKCLCLKGELTEFVGKNENLQKKSKALDEVEKEAFSQVEFRKLKGMVMMNESLKDQENNFKLSCKNELSELQAKLKRLKNESNLESGKHVQKIEKAHCDIAAKHSETRSTLAAVSQRVISLRRSIDEIPSRAELIQYEKRFTELYDEVALILDETRKYYSIYNGLKEKHNFILKEVSIINSMNENFEKAMSTPIATKAYLMQIESIIENINGIFEKQSSLLQQKQLEVDTLDSKYQVLLDKQRAYFKAIREFQEECERNEKLNQKYQTLGLSK